MVYGVAYLSSRWVLRQPSWLLQSMLSMVGFAILLYAWGGLEGLRNIVLAWVIAALWSAGLNIVGQEVGWHRVILLHDMFVAGPLKPLHYLIGLFLVSLIFPCIELLILLPIALLLNALWDLLLAIVLGLPVLLSGITLGLTIVMRIEKPINVSAITNPIAWLLIILPPVYYPAWILPHQIRPIALLIPTSAAAEIVRQLVGMGASINILYPMTILFAWILIGTIMASKTIKWGLV